MKVLHIAPSFYPAHVYGGPIQTAYALCRHIAKLGCEVRILTTDAAGSNAVLDVEKGCDVTLDEDIRVRYCRRVIPESVSIELAIQISRAVCWADVVHLTAVYNFPTIPTLLAAKWNSKPVIWSPHGSLDRSTGRKNWLKPWWDRTCELVGPRNITLHVTSDEERDWCKALFPTYGSAVIPNGVEVPETVHGKQSRSNRELNVLYMGRYDPKKAIENLVIACAKLQGSGLHWRLTLAGKEQGPYSQKIRSLIQELGIGDRIHIAGEVTGEARERMFEWADVLVLPSKSENFGMVVAEALARAVPVIASRHTPWKEIEDIGCGLWVDNTPDALCAAIKQIGDMPLAEMGQRGRRWMNDRYSWAEMARRMLALYRARVEYDSRVKDCVRTARR